MSVTLTTFAKPDGDAPPVSFGDLMSLSWLNELHLSPRSERLLPITLKGGKAGFRPAEQHEVADSCIGYADERTSALKPHAAVIVSDECQVDDVLRGRPAQGDAPALSAGGRLLMAPLRPAQPDEMTMQAFRRAVVGAAGEWPVPDDGYEHGGLIDFDRSFMVKLGENDVPGFVSARIGVPTDRDLLLRRWSAYAVRRGPLVAEVAAVQARELLTGEPAGPAAEQVFNALSLLWAGEGAIEDRVSEAMEQVRLAGEEQRDEVRAEQAERLRLELPKALRAIAEAAQAGAEEIEAMSASISRS